MTIHQKVVFDSNYVDLRSLFNILILKKNLILTISVMVFLFSFTYALIKPINYQAKVILKVQHKQLINLGRSSNAMNQPYNTHLQDEPVSVQVALLRSEYVLIPVVKSLGLDIHVSPRDQSSFTFFKSEPNQNISISELELSKKVDSKPLLLTIDTPTTYHISDNNGRVLIRGRTDERISDNKDITVKIDHIQSPNGSQFYLKKIPTAGLVNQLRSALTINDLSNSSDNNTNKVAILQLSLVGDDAKKIADTLQRIATTIQEKNILLKSVEADKALTFLKKQLPIVKNSLKQAEAKLHQYRSNNGNIDIKLQTQYLLTHISDIEKQLEKIRLEKINMLQKYTRYHPFVISLTEEHNELENQRKELISKLNKLPASDQEAASLSRDVDVKNSLYMLLLSQIHQLEVVREGIISDIEILSSVTAPEMVPGTSLFVIAFFSFIIGLIMACVFVLIWRMMIGRIDDPNWFEQNWNIKNLAVIPYSKDQANYLNIHRYRQTARLPLLTYQAPNDIVIESLYNLRTILQLNFSNTKNNIIAVLGLSKGVGKTFITANLASLYAKINDSVLLIDSDIRHGHMHRYFTNESTPGLSDVLKGEATIEESLVTSKEFENLTFLPSGKQLNHSTDLLMSSEFKSLLTTLSKSYKYIFINTASNPSTTDSLIISMLAGTNLLVLGAHMHEHAEIDRIMKNMQHASVALNGCIFNNVTFNHIKSIQQHHGFQAMIYRYSHAFKSLFKS